MDKKALRKQLLQTRKQLTPSDWKLHSQNITARLLDQSCFQSVQTILAYFSIRQEPDLTALWMDEAIESGLRFGFPRCEAGSTMTWHRWQPGESLVSGAFGILEPSETAPELTAADVDWMLVPCVGCDRQGYRLGYGGGFYDRLLEKPEWQRVKTIGITFDFGLTDEFTPEIWDQPLDYVCTEKQWIAFNR